MAEVFNLSFGAVGEHGRKQRHNVLIPRGALTLAQVQGFADEYAPLLDDVMDTQIVDAQLTIGLTLPGGLKTEPTDGSDAGRGAILSFSADATSYSHGIYLPGLIESMRVGSDGVITAGPSVMATLIAALVSGLDIGGTQVQPGDRAGADLLSLLSASQSKRK